MPQWVSTSLLSSIQPISTTEKAMMKLQEPPTLATRSDRCSPKVAPSLATSAASRLLRLCSAMDLRTFFFSVSRSWTSLPSNFNEDRQYFQIGHRKAPLFMSIAAIGKRHRYANPRILNDACPEYPLFAPRSVDRVFSLSSGRMGRYRLQFGHC